MYVHKYTRINYNHYNNMVYDNRAIVIQGMVKM